MSAAPVQDRPITYEEMLAEARAARRARLSLRRMMVEEGSLREPLHDRRQKLLEAMENFFARCLVKRVEVSELLRGVAIAPIDDRDL